MTETQINGAGTNPVPAPAQLAVIPQQKTEAESSFALAQRHATALSKSTLVPKDYRDNLPNCLIALEISQRTGSSALMVMQNLHIIHGKPSWSSTYIIAAINSCGRFKPLRLDLQGEGDAMECIAWTVENNIEISGNIGTLAAAKAAGLPILEGPPVSMAMAKAEGWLTKDGSKWKTMPKLMIRYRAASFFGRLYAPELLMGMRSAEEESEIIDITPSRTSTTMLSDGDPFERATAGGLPEPSQQSGDVFMQAASGSAPTVVSQAAVAVAAQKSGQTSCLICAGRGLIEDENGKQPCTMCGGAK